MRKLHLCMQRLIRAEMILRWVLDECDLSGQMELDRTIRAFLGKV